MNLRPLGPLVRMAAVIFGGVATLNLASAATIKVLRFASEKKREKVALPCWVCRGKGFYICKLCNGNATISWSPMFDPIAVNPCVCPTCEEDNCTLLTTCMVGSVLLQIPPFETDVVRVGVQRCLNCLGKGYD
ncbi:hypothetical protein HKD37_17G047445 [Glycine soja]